jgi:tripartite-type tricarboxylate transporter receptor subunit TctC
MGVTGTNAISGSLYKKLPFDPATAFAPVSLIVTAPLVLLPRPELPAKTFADYVKSAKAKPDALSYASPGNGTTMHLAGAMLASETGASLLHVPYKGSGPALQNLMGNQVDSMFADLMQVLPQIQSGDLKAIAVTSKQRHPLLPNVPTVAESGFQGFEALSWHALFAPAGTPPAVVEKLHAAVAQALKEPDMQKHFESLGLVIEGRTPAQTQAFVQEEIRKWGRIVRQTGVSQD